MTGIHIPFHFLWTGGVIIPGAIYLKGTIVYQSQRVATHRQRLGSGASAFSAAPALVV